MTYDKRDPIFYAWAERHGLQIYTDRKDAEVRMVRIYDKGEEHAGIGISFALIQNGVSRIVKRWSVLGERWHRPAPISE
jgi:hypothetical protein